VYVDEEGYHLFYTTFFCDRDKHYYYSWEPADSAACDIVNVVSSIADAFSSDRGRSWLFRVSPVLLPAEQGWDSGDIETASVARVDDRLVLAYSVFGEKDGEMMNQRYEIGAAELELDGRSINEAMMDDSSLFSRRPEPLLENYRDVPRFGNNVQEPSQPINDPSQKIESVGLSRRFR
jgi:hypothetical protein